MDRNTEFQAQQHRKRIDRRVREIQAVDFFNMLTSPALLDKIQASLDSSQRGNDGERGSSAFSLK